MVSFSCDQCADVVKKPQLDQHHERCHNKSFTCLDCSKTFRENEYKAHTSCISEVEKYQKETPKEKKKKEISLDKSKQKPKQKQNIGNSNETNQEPTLKKKNKDKKMNSNKDPKKGQEQTSIGEAPNGSKKNKHKKKNAANTDAVKEDKKEKVKVENKNNKMLAEVSKKRKAEDQPPVEPNQDKEKRVKNSDIPKVESGIQKLKRRLEEQRLEKLGLGNGDNPKEHPGKAQNPGDQATDKNKIGSINEASQMSLNQSILSMIIPTIGEEAKKRKHEQQVAESESSKVKKKQKTQTGETSSEKQKTQAVETSSKKQKTKAVQTSSENQKTQDASSGKQNKDANGKKKKKKKSAAGKGNGDTKNNGSDFKFSATEVVKKIFKDGKHQEITLQQLEKIVVDQFAIDPKNTLNSNELLQKFRENVAFVFKDGNVLLK